MKQLISKSEFNVFQPSMPAWYPSDYYYLKLANGLAETLKKADEAEYLNTRDLRLLSIILTNYFEDIVSDAGIWRGFAYACKSFYGKYVPFYEEDDNYIPYELNRSDIRFLIWYFIALYKDDFRLLSPMDCNINRMADAVFNWLDVRYDEAPEPEGYNLSKELDLNAPEEKETVYRLASWLFINCYLMIPAYAETMRLILSNISDSHNVNIELRDALDKSMTEDPTGPLALYTKEWLRLIVEEELPEQEDEENENAPVHSYYEKFTALTGGKTIAFFGSYNELDSFLDKVLHGSCGGGHLPHLKNEHDFIAMVDRSKGLLIAKNICRCVAAPDNAYYDREYAKMNAIKLLTFKGLCPRDLLLRIHREKWLPDASFQGERDEKLVADNFDFIARCYLQKFYRGD